MSRAVLVGLVVSILPTPALANGVNTHTFIALSGRDQLPPGQLRDLLTEKEHEQQLINGAVFPDGGYAVEDGYGEIAHWEPFFSSYVRWIRKNYQPPYQGEGAAHVALLLGAASHGIADPIFDGHFVAAAEQHETERFGNGLIDGVDAITDVLLVAATGQDIMPNEDIRPKVLVEVFQGMKEPYQVAPELLLDGQHLIGVAIAAGKSGAKNARRVKELSDMYRWTSDHLFDAWIPGSVPCLARAASSYQQALWDRLHGEHLEENMVIGTVPSDGAMGHSTDASTAESQLLIVFGYEMSLDGLKPDMLTITDGTGKPYGVSIHGPYGSSTGNTARLVPREDWAKDQDFTVTLAPGLKTTDGVAMEKPLTFHFSTRVPTEASLPPCMDPTPNQGDPAKALVDPESGGCMVMPGRRDGTGLAFLVLFATCLVAMSCRTTQRRPLASRR
ncbi:MAG: Ig-like domain-containing protein [Deltaproteobacteria bacterium]|nr:Ig-like domain-containing protein [Deltaproteobacteria bacterium]